jgi:hypothetical protein
MGQQQPVVIVSLDWQLPGVKQPFGNDFSESQKLNVCFHQ